MTEVISNNTCFRIKEPNSLIGTKCGEIWLANEEFFFICALCDQNIPNVYEYFEHLKEIHIENINSNQDDEILEYEDETDTSIEKLSTEVEQFEHEKVEQNINNKDEIDNKVFEKPAIEIERFEYEIVEDELVNKADNSNQSQLFEEIDCCKVIKEELDTNLEKNDDPVRVEESISKKSRRYASRILAFDRKERNIQCEECGKCFKIMSQLKKHLNIHYGIKPYKCKVCGIAFTHFGSFRSHRFVHSEEKPYPCQECDKRFISPSHLKIHTKIHTGQLYKCEICGKQLTRMTSYRRHINRHKSKHVPCQHCDKKFVNEDALNKHMKRLPGRPYHCDLCDKTLSRMSTFEKHMWRHQGKLNYHCQHCDKNFIDNATLNKHIKRNCKKRNLITNADEVEFNA